MNEEIIISMSKSIIQILEGRLEILEHYRNKDLGKEILDTLNDIKRYKKILEEYE